MRRFFLPLLLAVACDAAVDQSPSTCPEPQFATLRSAVEQACDCDSDGTPTDPQGQPEAKSSGGSLQLPQIQLSRSTCTSPCTVMFSLEEVFDPATFRTFSDLGTFWDYGDPDSPLPLIERGAQFVADDAAVSRNEDFNSPLGMHTYVCETGECTFYPGVAVRSDVGDWVTAWATVQVTSQEAAFPGEQTVCVSQNSNWEGCPQGARQTSTIPVLQSWESGTRYLLRNGESFPQTCLPYDISDITISTYGDGDRARLERPFGIGRDRNCGDALPPSSSGYENPYWVSNITVEGIRVPEIGVGMTFRDITLHDLDMDYEDQDAGGTIRALSADACSRRPELTCDVIPTPQGMYITDTELVGSRVNPPGLNIQFLSSSCVSYFGAKNNLMQVAFEHNLRLECASRVLVAHNDANGDHLGNRGRKNAITVRPEGYSRDDMLGGMKRDNAGGFGFQYGNRHVAIIANYLGIPGARANNAARISLAPSDRSRAEATYGAVVSRNIVDLDPAARPFRDVQLSGEDLVCYTDNQWQSVGCNDNGRNALPVDSYNPSSERPAPTLPQRPSTY